MPLKPQISVYTQAFADVLHDGDGSAVAALLSLASSLPSGHPFAKQHARHAPAHPVYGSNKAKEELLSAVGSLAIPQRLKLGDMIAEALGGDKDADNWGGILSAHLVSTTLLSTAKKPSEYEAAYSAQHSCLEKVLAVFCEEETNWLVPALHVVVHDTVYLMRQLESMLAAEGSKESVGEQLNTLVTTVRYALNNTANHRVPKDAMATSKKLGALYLANILISILYRADQLRQCKATTTAVEGPGFPPLSGFPLSQVVTYEYYTGLLAMYEDQFTKAESMLGSALRKCHKGYKGNKRRILKALIPVRIYCLGHLPSKELLKRYGLQAQYGEIVEAVRTGDVSRFSSTMEENREWYIRTGVYLLLERLQLYVYRTLFKRACSIVSEMTGSVQIKLPFLQAALRASGIEMDMDEVECILANLIHRKLVKGYLSHMPPVLVLSKKSPFGPLPEVLAATGPAGRGVSVPDV